ncbi:hypothetical protein R1flu_013217 [Riccia fluitans]|uniref:Uncharacterized protein n=1 Tax=Riccia fluitans TaxID=41844 RepID=A0ABD1YCP6_9MARC
MEMKLFNCDVPRYSKQSTAVLIRQRLFHFSAVAAAKRVALYTTTVRNGRSGKRAHLPEVDNSCTRVDYDHKVLYCPSKQYLFDIHKITRIAELRQTNSAVYGIGEESEMFRMQGCIRVEDEKCERSSSGDTGAKRTSAAANRFLSGNSCRNIADEESEQILS